MATLKSHSAIIFSQQIEMELEKIFQSYHTRKIFLLTERTPEKFCLPLVSSIIGRYSIPMLVIEGGEISKSIRTVEKVWQFLSENGADRKSLLVNMGGGMLTDLGGFAASCFKRGIEFINLPTTLLAQVDASLGGKTGINFNGLKNEIGVFNDPKTVIINTNFLKTIDDQNFKSGFAEMIKHGFIKDPEHLDQLRQFDFGQIDLKKLELIIARSVSIKEWHVHNDPTEKGIRKALNFGHTAGHAFESFALHQNHPILHGYAVAYGMITELYLSSKISGLAKEQAQDAALWLKSIYGRFPISKDDYNSLYQLMTHDKKNEAGRINFTLLHSYGHAVINQDCSRALIEEALDFFRSINA